MKDKLREAVADLEAGVTTDAGYTVQNAVTDFLQELEILALFADLVGGQQAST